MNKQNLKIAIGAGALLLIGGYLVYEWYKSGAYTEIINTHAI